MPDQNIYIEIISLQRFHSSNYFFPLIKKSDWVPLLPQTLSVSSLDYNRMPATASLPTCSNPLWIPQIIPFLPPHTHYCIPATNISRNLLSSKAPNRLKSDPHLSYCFWSPIPQDSPQLCSWNPAVASFSSLNQSPMDHKDILLQLSLLKLIPVSQHPTAGIPCELTSWTGQENRQCWAITLWKSQEEIIIKWENTLSTKANPEIRT